MAETKSVCVADFFSKENEDNGIWYEVKVRGVGTGIELKVYGPNSNHASVAQDKYRKAREEVDKIDDVSARSEATDKILAEFASALIADIRGKDGVKLVNKDGSDTTVKDIKDIMLNAPIIASDVVKFQQNQNNFLSK
jgi:hypothetical protein